eukprot:TRINITY_DN2319_c0_g2_i1.p1 TRINITY_DN2319_c0_g2~~TRINITY_DN2319_c0_g2_i1.p1  ORF type:complete len:364 (+),score=82.46 TRINITY_DN2319_c0_g2_i1:78-1094(+)
MAAAQTQRSLSALTLADLQSSAPVKLQESATLTEAAEALLSAERTSAIVFSSTGEVLGAFTENDLMRAYFLQMPWDYKVGAWLHTDCARAPSYALPAVTVDSSLSVLEAALKMRELADTEFAWHHLVVRDKGEVSSVGAMLSSLDLCRALGLLVPGGPSAAAGGAGGGQGQEGAVAAEVATILAEHVVGDVMKPRASVPVCGAGVTLNQAFDEMIVAQQNCTALLDAGDASAEAARAPQLNALLTSRDAVAAFARGMPGKTRAEAWTNEQARSRIQPRMLPADAKLLEAASLMASTGLHHLVVVSPTTSGFVGVLSSLDVVHAIAAADASARARQGGS